MAVSEEKIQQRSRRRGQFSSSRLPCRKVPKPSFALPENRGIIFQQRRNLPENLSSREFRTATAFSSFLSNISCPQFWGRKWLRQFYGHLENMPSFCRRNLRVHKIPRFRGGYLGVFRGGGVKVPILFLWARGFF